MGEVSAIAGHKSKLPRTAKRRGDSTMDRIWKYYYVKEKNIKLSAKEEQIRQRWELAWLMDSTLLTGKKIVLRLVRKFGITERQGYFDIKNARLLFSDPSQQNKEARRLIMSNLLEGMIRKAVAQDNFKAAERLMLRYEKINGLDKDDNNEFAEMLRKQKPAQIIFSIDPEVLKKNAAKLIEDVEDVEFEEME